MDFPEIGAFCDVKYIFETDLNGYTVTAALHGRALKSILQLDNLLIHSTEAAGDTF